MAYSARCIHCGGLVSTEADECPHCHRLPRPFTPYQDPRPAAYAPEDDFTCPVCRVRWSPDAFRFQYRAGMDVGPNHVESPQRCPRDGHPIRVNTCQYCRKGVFEGTGRTVVQYGTTLHYHLACFQVARPTDLPAKSSPQGCAIVLSAAILLALCAEVLASWGF